MRRIATQLIQIPDGQVRMATHLKSEKYFTFRTVNLRKKIKLYTKELHETFSGSGSKSGREDTKGQ